MEKNVVVINKKTASNTKIIEINGDIIVPDIKPDIVNIINTNGILQRRGKLWKSEG